MEEIMIVSKLIKETGYSRDQICRECRALRIPKAGKAYYFPRSLVPSIIDGIKKRRPGNPNFKKKN